MSIIHDSKQSNSVYEKHFLILSERIRSLQTAQVTAFNNFLFSVQRKQNLDDDQLMKACFFYLFRFLNNNALIPSKVAIKPKR